MEEFIILLRSFNQTMEEKKRKAARSVVARTCLVGPRVFRPEQAKAVNLQDTRATPILATQFVVQSDGIQSAANLAAPTTPGDQKSMYLQKLEDSNFRRPWRLISALGKVRQGALEKKDVK